MSQRYNNNIQKAKAARYSARALQNLCILPENWAEGLGSKKEHWWSYIACLWE